MRQKRATMGMRACALMAFLVVSVMSLMAASALALPEGRAYEMVSPPYKGGYGAPRIEAVASDGESVAFYSPGVFAGSPAGFGAGVGLDSLAYLARRSPSGWSTASVVPPDVLAPVVQDHDVSPTLSAVLAFVKAGPNGEAADVVGTEQNFLLHSTTMPDVSTSWELAGMPLKMLVEEPLVLRYKGGNPDFCQLLFQNTEATAEASNALLEEAVGTSEQLYELSRGCGGEPAALRLVALNNEGEVISPSCKVDLGVQRYATQEQSLFNAISADGSEIFFTTCIKKDLSHSQLFVRLGSTKTLEVSKPVGEACSEVPCLPGATARANANFVGASEDGSKVFFTTTAQLVPEDKDAGNDLYMARIGCPESKPGCEVAEKEVTSLVLVSHAKTAGEAAEVQGVVKLAPDGQRAYFVAHGILSDGVNAEGNAPMKGAENLYVSEPDTEVPGQYRTVFVADLCSGPELSGSVEDLRCPSKTGVDRELWSSTSGGQAQTAGVDGGFLVFASYGQLLPSDTDSAQDVYRYDAVSGKLDRVSAGEAGADANGNNSVFDATLAAGNRGGSVRSQYEMNNRAISEDGSRIVFTTAEPLSPDASNGLANVYEWHKEPGEAEGWVSLVSGGSGNEPVEDVVISPAGGDIFFVTSQGLLPQDTDGAPDVYDARLGGGFPVSSAPARPCSGDACQGPLTNPAPLLVPGSGVQAPGENIVAPTGAAPALAATPKKAALRCRKGREPRRGKCVKAKAKSKKNKAGKASNKRGVK